MGQDFLVLDLETRERLGGGCKLGEFFYDPNPQAIEYLRVPVNNDSILDELVRGTVTAQVASALLRLAQELYDMVLDELQKEDYVDLLCCAVTCKAALVRSRRHIRAHQQRHRASMLGGHRIICVGDWLSSLEGLPVGMLTKEEEQQLLDSVAGSEEEDEPSLASYAYGHYKYPAGTESRGYWDPSNRHLTRSWTPYGWRSEDWHRVRSIGLPYYPTDVPWALCNFTKREYVDEGAATRFCKRMMKGKEHYYSQPKFWHFLLANICWSNGATFSIHYREEDLWAGHWAGDRIAVDLLDSLPPAAEGEEPWKDVTEDVGALVKRIWGTDTED